MRHSNFGGGGGGDDDDQIYGMDRDFQMGFGNQSSGLGRMPRMDTAAANTAPMTPANFARANQDSGTPSLSSNAGNPSEQGQRTGAELITDLYYRKVIPRVAAPDFTKLGALYVPVPKWTTASAFALYAGGHPDPDFDGKETVIARREADTVLRAVGAAAEKRNALVWRPEDAVFMEQCPFFCKSVGPLFGAQDLSGGIYHINWRHFVLIVFRTTATTKHALGYHYFSLSKQDAIAGGCI